MTDETYLDTRSRVATKTDELIQRSRFSLSLQQQKIVLYLSLQVTPYDDDFKLYEFNIRDFCRICGIDMTSGKNYGDLKAAIKDIRDKSIWVTLEDGRKTTLSWIEKPYIDHGSGIVQIRLDKDMKPFLLQLKENFTSYELIWALRFRSKYTVRLYELIKDVHFHELEYSLDELKRILGAETYRTYQTFKVRVLLPAIEQINTQSDKNVTYVPIKKGRMVDRIRFTISSKDSLEALKIRSAIEKELGIDQLTLWDMIESRGLT